MTFVLNEGAPDVMKPVKKYLNVFSNCTKERILLSPSFPKRMNHDMPAEVNRAVSAATLSSNAAMRASADTRELA